MIYAVYHIVYIEYDILYIVYSLPYAINSIPYTIDLCQNILFTFLCEKLVRKES